MFIKQNKSLHTNYIYKTKTKQNVYRQVMFTKQTNVYKTKLLQTRYVYKTKTKQKFTNICL